MHLYYALMNVGHAPTIISSSAVPCYLVTTPGGPHFFKKNYGPVISAITILKKQGQITTNISQYCITGLFGRNFISKSMASTKIKLFEKHWPYYKNYCHVLVQKYNL